MYFLDEKELMNKENTLRKVIYYVALVLFLNSFLFSQTEVPQQIFDIHNKKYERSLEYFYQTRSITRTISPQVLEGILNEIDYQLGPGDVFNIHIWGEMENEYNLAVNPQGTLIIPTVGELKVGELSLAEARKLIMEKVRQVYINSKVSVNLVQLRKFRVYLAGEVQNAGTYFAQASDRLSDIIEISEGVTDWADGTRIEIHHRDGSMDVYDLTEFYRNGDKTNNPYLRDGDVIFVPSINLTNRYVIIEGNVGYQGIYSLKPGEKLYNFLRRVGALNKQSDLENIILFRDGEKIHINLLKDDEKYFEFELKNKDRIILPSIPQVVYVRGEVAKPGAYSYLANYRVRDYVGQAGALETGVPPDEYLVIRAKTGKVYQGSDTIVKKGDTIIVQRRKREIVKDYITIITPVASLLIAILALIK